MASILVGFIAILAGVFWPLALGALHIFGFRFRLRTLIVLMTVASLALGILSVAVRNSPPRSHDHQ